MDCDIVAEKFINWNEILENISITHKNVQKCSDWASFA